MDGHGHTTGPAAPKVIKVIKVLIVLRVNTFRLQMITLGPASSLVTAIRELVVVAV